MKKSIILSVIISICLLGVTATSSAQFQLFEEYGVEQSDLSLHQVLPTSDAGYLLVNARSCYFPGVVISEGCLLNFHLIKTDAIGQVLWKSDIPTYSSFFFNVKVIENSDHTYTLTISEPTSNQCDEIEIGGFGWEKTTTYQISEEGEILETIIWQNECTFTFEDMISLEDDNKLMINNANQEAFDFVGGKSLKIDKENQIIESNDFSENTFGEGRLLKLANNQIFLFYKEDNINRLSLLDHTGDLQWSETISEDELLYPHDLWELSDGNLLLSLYHVTEPNQTYLIKVAPDASLIWESNITAFKATNLIQIEDYFIFGSTILSENSDQEIALVYIDEYGELIENRVIANEQWEQTTQIFVTSDNRLGIAGNLNCCDEESFEPAKVFLSVVDNSFITNAKAISLEHRSRLSPNPTNGMISIQVAEFRQMANFLLFTNDGTLIHNELLQQEQTTLDIHSLPSGLYFYQILNADKVETSKLIKQ